MRLILAIVLLLSFSNLEAQKMPSMSSIPGPKLVSLYSEIVGEEYQLLLTFPLQFNPEKKYPVFYYLDAWGTSGAMNELALSRMWNKSIDPVILVGISYNTDPFSYGSLRKRDYAPMVNKATKEGKADDFLQFIKTELIPFMEENYSAAVDNRGLMGYSYGGLFAAWALRQEPELFQKLALTSPSLWYEDYYLFNDEQFLNNISSAKDLRVFLSIGSLEGGVKDSKKLYELMKANPSIESTFVVFDGETHGTVGSAAQSRGINFLYEHELRRIMKVAELAYAKKDYPLCLQKYEEAFSKYPREMDEGDQYNFACLYSLNGKADKAFELLELAVDEGYSDIQHINKDKDFKNIHKDARWKPLLEKVKSNNKKANN